MALSYLTVILLMCTCVLAALSYFSFVLWFFNIVVTKLYGRLKVVRKDRQREGDTRSWLAFGTSDGSLCWNESVDLKCVRVWRWCWCAIRMLVISCNCLTCFFTAVWDRETDNILKRTFFFFFSHTHTYVYLILIGLSARAKRTFVTHLPLCQ